MVGRDVLLRMHTLKHQQCSPQIPSALLRNPLIQAPLHSPALLLPTPLQHLTNLALARRRNPNQQRPRPNRRNDIRRTIRQQYQPEIRTVFLHRPPQRRLRITRKMIRLIDNHDLKPLLRARIHLLGLRHFFEQVLHDDAVVITDV